MPSGHGEKMRGTNKYNLLEIISASSNSLIETDSGHIVTETFCYKYIIVTDILLPPFVPGRIVPAVIL